MSFYSAPSSGRVIFIILLLVLILNRCSHPPKQFTEMTPEETGIDFRNDVTESQHNNIMTYEYSYNGGGVAAGDINNDGLPDLYFSGNSVANRLFLNKGNFHFKDVTEKSNTAGRSESWKTGVTMADVNGDGWLDIYVCYSGNAHGEGYNKPVIRDHPKRTNQLFINNGCEPGGVPTFTERAKEYGLDAIGTFSTQAYFFDYDSDNDLDMLLINHANMFYSAFFNTNRLRNLRHPYFGNKLFRNNSRKTPEGKLEISFADVSDDAGLHGSGLNFGLSASISDLNFDNRPDIYVTNDYDEQDFCYINNGDGSFTEVSHTLFAHLSKFGMGSDIADINNDGLQDIMVLDMLPEDNYRQKLLRGPDEYDRYTRAADSGYHHQYMRNTLQLNRGFAEDGLPRFSEIGQMAGVSNTDWSWAPLFVDLDNDGWKDIFIGNGYLRDFNNMDFIKYTTDQYAKASDANKPVDYLKVIQELPSTQLKNYLFRNDNGINFTNVTTDWGLTSKTVSNGAVYADLDNDGDYDLVTNNLNDGAAVLRNNQEKIQQHHYLKIRLQGKGLNSHGIGAKVWITLSDKKIFHEAISTRGYQSSVEPVLTIGIGQEKTVRSIEVMWPDGTQSREADLQSGSKVIVIKQDNAVTAASNPALLANTTILHDVTREAGVDFVHRENDFVDFKRDKLLHYQLSRLGGKIVAGDVNGDGNDDVFFGGASGQAAQLFLGNNDGTFRKTGTEPWNSDATYEDLDAAFLDADSDNDLDLYVVSGGSEFIPGAPLYQDRLYINDGTGKFSKLPDALPVETSSGSCVVAADYDKDGDTDLFVGGRHSPSSYGVLPRSFLLQNNSTKGNIRFTEITRDVNGELSNPGMVTDALWTDYNNDSWPDLLVVGEWMAIRIFENKNGKLVELNDASLERSNGWWTCVAATDIDGDGDQDYFLGNAGTNMQFKATRDMPVQLYVNDFNSDKTLDPILCYPVQGKSYPLPSRDELLDQITPLRKKFIKYADYANATINDIGDESQVAKAYKFDAYILESSWLENTGGGTFRLKALPAFAQISCINGFLFDDFDSNGSREIIAAGNFFPYKPQLGRSDASTGIILRYEKGDVKVSDDVRAQLWMSGDVRDMAILKFTSGIKRVLVSRNNDACSVYSMKPGTF